jgi:hypothetical protein
MLPSPRWGEGLGVRANPRGRLICLERQSQADMRYFKRYWNESRGDEHQAWGGSWWFFEVDGEGNVERQIEVYDRGPTLRYSRSHLEDEFGALAEKPLNLNEFGDFEVTSAEFQATWKSAPA